MLSIETEGKIAKIFYNLAIKEREVELNRQLLSNNSNFDAYNIYNIIEKEGKNAITAINIVDYLHSNAVYATITEAKFIILFYDENDDNMLSYFEFLNLLISDNNSNLKRSEREKILNSYSPIQKLPFNIKNCVLNLFQSELELVRSTMDLIEDAKMRYDFNIHHAFHSIKNFDNITLESLSEFLKRNMISYNKDDIFAMFKRLDLNKDRLIDFKEFQAFFSFPSNARCCKCIKECLCSCGSTTMTNIHNENNRITSDNINPNFKKSLQNEDYINNSNTNVNMGVSMSPNVKIISSNLSLRKSPERKYSPHSSPMRNTNMNLNMTNLNNDNANDTKRNYNIPNSEIKSSLTLRKSPIRSYSPKSQQSPIRKSPHPTHSPSICHSPHHCCIYCHTHPCICCQISYENAENSFISYLKEVMHSEFQIEKAKIDLANTNDFNVENAFRIFELDGGGILTERDLKYGLTQLDIYATQRDINLLMRRVDIKKRGYISFEDFFDLVTPYDREYRNIVENRPPVSFTPKFNKADAFLLSTKIYLQNLLRIVMNCESKLENMKMGMNGAREYLKNIYNDLDSCGMGIISNVDLASYIKRKGISCTEEESGLAFIRLDRNRNGKVEYWEIMDEITKEF